MNNLWGREPTMVLALVQAIITLGITFGLHLNESQIGSILTVSTLAIALITRTQVVPANQIQDKIASIDAMIKSERAKEIKK